MILLYLRCKVQVATAMTVSSFLSVKAEGRILQLASSTGKMLLILQ